MRRILISTTTNWNCGDQFILFGVKNILNEMFHESPCYINYDRNPNNMVDYTGNQNMKEGLHGTFMNNPIDWDLVQMVVLAGSPEFLHEPLAPIYEGLAKHTHIPLLAIGVGYSYEDFVKPLTDCEMQVLKRPNTLIITRQEQLSNNLKQLLDREIFTLPCPALFCFKDFPEKKYDICNNLAHSLDELERENYFSSDPYEMLEYIGSHRVVHSHRLHGAIAGISSGAKSYLYNDSFRATEAIKLFESVIGRDEETIKKFKDETFRKYIKILKNQNFI